MEDLAELPELPEPLTKELVYECLRRAQAETQPTDPAWHEKVRFAAYVALSAVLREREACAKACVPSLPALQLAVGEMSAKESRAVRAALQWIATAIRNRGK